MHGCGGSAACSLRGIDQLRGRSSGVISQAEKAVMDDAVPGGQVRNRGGLARAVLLPAFAVDGDGP